MKKISFLLPESIHRLIKLQSVKEGISITQYILGLLKKDLNEKGVNVGE